jgi:outer membrane protein
MYSEAEFRVYAKENQMRIDPRPVPSVIALVVFVILVRPGMPVFGQEPATRPNLGDIRQCRGPERNSKAFWPQTVHYNTEPEWRMISSDAFGRNSDASDSNRFSLKVLPGSDLKGTPLKLLDPCSAWSTPKAVSLARGFDPYESAQITPRTQSLVPRGLSLRDAVDLAKANNFSTRSARERENEARGRAWEQAAGLLPDLSGSASQASVTANLASFGFQQGLFPGLQSSFLGPFRVFDARVRLVQSLVNLNALRRYQSGRAGILLSKLEEKLAVEQVATMASLAYLEAVRSQQAEEAAMADLELANSLLKLAIDQHDVGIATGVDVIRAQTRSAQQQVVVAESQRASDQACLQLLRITGLPLSSEFGLTDPLRFNPEPSVPIESRVALAEQNRLEVQIACEQVRLNEYERKAALAEQLPSLEFDGDYGNSGITPSLVNLPTRSVAIHLNVPIFNGGATRGRIEQATSREQQSELALNDVRAQVEEDVRLAERTLAATANAVVAANLALSLALRELQMARDRFAAGVGDNLEVVNAQTATADARLSQVTALAQYNSARLNLASALGRAQSFTL